MIIHGLSPGPLPPAQDVHHKLRYPNELSAYTTVYNFQQQVHGDKSKVIRARVLGYLLLLAPNDVVRAEVVQTIVSCRSDQALYDLGDTYIDFFIRPCKSSFQ